MADVWFGLCTNELQEQVRKGLRLVRPHAKLTFVESAHEIRARVQESHKPVGAVVGPLEDGSSSVNVAAALVHDHMALEVMVAVSSLPNGFEERARMAGINEVIDLSGLDARELADLDEPSLCDDDVPTILWGRPPSTIVDADRLPVVERQSRATKPEAMDEEGEVTTQVLIPPSVALANHMAAPPALASPVLSSPASVVPLHATPVRVEEGSLRGEVSNVRNKLPIVQSEAFLPKTRSRVPEAGHAPVIVLTSGRGGVGKTTLVATMGIAAQRWGMRVALCDLDLWFGNLYSCFGMTGPADLGSVARNDASKRELLSYGRDAAPNLTLWGPCAMPELSETVYPFVGTLLDALSSHYELVLVDTSVSFTDAVAQAVQQCDRLVLTVDGREGSGAAQSRLAALAVRLGVARTRIVRLANRCGPRGRGEPLINRADVGLETARSMRVQDGGGEVSDCMGEGKAFDLFDIGSRFADSASSALAQLLSEMGCLPDCREARTALERRADRPRWGFGRRKEAI